MRRLLEWLYALKVCYKYKILPFPFRFGNRGSYGRWLDDKDRCIFSFIWMSPLNDNFMSVFMHEVGHNIYWKRGYKQKPLKGENSFSLRLNETGFFKVLHEESFATRFSRKSLGKKFELDIMMKYFHTYTGTCFYWIPRFKLYHEQESLTDFVIKMEKRISK